MKGFGVRRKPTPKLMCYCHVQQTSWTLLPALPVVPAQHPPQCNVCVQDQLYSLQGPRAKGKCRAPCSKLIKNLKMTALNSVEGPFRQAPVWLTAGVTPCEPSPICICLATTMWAP